MEIINNTACEMCISDENELDFSDNHIYIYIALLNKTHNVVKNLTKIRFKETDKINFKFDEDGFYIVCRIRIHNGETEGYYYDNKKFYYNGVEITLQDIVDISGESDIEDDSIELHYKGFFSTCRLRKCFVTLCKKILDEAMGAKCSTKADSELIYQRDLVWSVYNTIQYLLDFGQYMEAQKLIERVNVCPGICQGVEPSNGGGCGCHAH